MAFWLYVPVEMCMIFLALRPRRYYGLTNTLGNNEGTKTNSVSLPNKICLKLLYVSPLTYSS